MRCLAVAEFLISQKNTVHFAMQSVSEQLRPRIEDAGINIIDLAEKQSTIPGLRETVMAMGADILVLDGYHLSYDTEQAFRETPVRTIRFDDYMPGDRCYANIVVNASPHAKRSEYQTWASGADLLLGPRYIAFRSDMIAGYHARQGVIENHDVPPASIMVNFGGSDPLDMTLATVKALSEQLPDVTIEAVTGAAYPKPQQLADLNLKNFKHHHNSGNLAAIIQRARLAISAGGLTVQELALFRVPTILAITAANQVKGAHVSWCKTLRPNWQSEDKNTDKIIAEIALEAHALWHSDQKRTQIIDRIPAELDIHGSKRISDAMLKEPVLA